MNSFSLFCGAMGSVLISSVLSGCGSGVSESVPSSDAELNSSFETQNPISVESFESPSKIIGENDLLPVRGDGRNVPRGFVPMLDAIGRVSMGCTATHLGNGVVLSAGHCFDAPYEPEKNARCDGLTVTWGKRLDVEPYLVSNCRRILIYQDGAALDYALFVVRPIPRAKVKLSRRAAPVGTAITLFSHPRGRDLEWSGECEVMDPALADRNELVFVHQCDTENGSSGAAIFDMRRREVVGVHNGGLVPYNFATPTANTPLSRYRKRFENARLPSLWRLLKNFTLNGLSQ